MRTFLLDTYFMVAGESNQHMQTVRDRQKMREQHSGGTERHRESNRQKENKEAKINAIVFLILQPGLVTLFFLLWRYEKKKNR